MGLAGLIFPTEVSDNRGSLFEQTDIIFASPNPFVDSPHPTCFKEVRGLIESLNIQHSDIVYRQYAIESGWGTSILATEHNNLFGMTYPTSRPTTATGKTESGFAIYNSVRESVIDYAIWQSTFAFNLTEKEYLSYLGKVYAEDPKYIWKLTK